MKAAAIIFFSLWGIACAINNSYSVFMDRVDLVFHEAGHVIFGLFGWEFLTILGGTLMQLLVPAVITAYFFIKGQMFSAAVTGIWLAQSFFNVSVYAKDAWAMQLPLLGGEDSIHDWNWMLTELDLLGHVKLVGNIIYGMGITVLIISSVVGLYFSFEKREHAIG